MCACGYACAYLEEAGKEDPRADAAHVLLVLQVEVDRRERLLEPIVVTEAEPAVLILKDRLAFSR